MNLDPEEFFQPKQYEALLTVRDNKYTLYGGAAGGGKSYFLRWLALLLLVDFYYTHGAKGVRVGLFSEDYPALRERHISKIPYEFPGGLGNLNRSEAEFRLCEDLGGGIIAFRNLDDPSKYLSSEFAAVLVDELTRNTRDIFDFLNMRMRWPGIAHTKFVGATNPGGIGHLWVKKLWVDKDFSGETLDPEDFAFVGAKYYDNKYLDSGYEKQLQSLPEKLREAYMQGNWDVFEGQFFPEFSRDVHVCTPFPIPDAWMRATGTDYGTAAPFCTLWGATDFSGDVWIYREEYGPGLNASEQARRILEATDAHIESYVADPSMWAKTQTVRDGKTFTLRSVADFYADEGVILTPGNNDRLSGANLVREYLKHSSDKEPRLHIFSTCKNLIRTLPALVHDKKKPEDVDTDGEDHAYDALRYLLNHIQQPIARVPADPLEAEYNPLGGYKDNPYKPEKDRRNVW